MWVWPQLVLEGSPPIPHCNRRALPSSQSPSLPALSLPLPPTPLGSFCNAPGRGGPVWCGGRGSRVQGGVEGRALQRYLGPDPHLGVLDLPRNNLKFTKDFLSLPNPHKPGKPEKTPILSKESPCLRVSKEIQKSKERKDGEFAGSEKLGLAPKVLQN